MAHGSYHVRAAWGFSGVKVQIVAHLVSYTTFSCLGCMSASKCFAIAWRSHCICWEGTVPEPVQVPLVPSKGGSQE